MKFTKVLLLALTLLSFSCGDAKKDDPLPQEDPLPNVPKANDNHRIEGDWIVKRMSMIEYDSLGDYRNESYQNFSSPSYYYRFKPNGIFEESYIDNGKFFLMYDGTYNLKGKVLTIKHPNDSTDLGIHAGVFTVDTLTTTKLTIIDTVGNVMNNPGIKYGVFRYSLYK